MSLGRRDKQAEFEKQMIFDPDYSVKRRKEVGIKVITIVMAILCAFMLGAIVTWTVIRVVGKNNLKAKAEVSHPTIETPETMAAPQEEKEQWKEGWIKYNGKIYSYNEKLMTFLFMGIDKNTKVKEVSEGTDGGQADALFLAVLNPEDQTIKIVGINRNTMCDIDIYNEDGDYVTTTTAQIAVQHGFGNGVEESCEYQIKAVRKLFYDLPIHGYAAINMKAIPIINDAVGGVDLVSMSDITDDSNHNKLIIREGESVHLMGNDAYWYVRDRDEEILGSADIRLARQKQYLNAFVNQAKTAAKKDLGVVSNLYNDVSPYMTTDISFDELLYLVPEMVNYSFDLNSLYLLQGETVMGEEFEEFYPDEDRLYEMIIDVFYNEVKNSNGDEN